MLILQKLVKNWTACFCLIIDRICPTVATNKYFIFIPVEPMLADISGKIMRPNFSQATVVREMSTHRYNVEWETE